MPIAAARVAVPSSTIADGLGSTNIRQSDTSVTPRPPIVRCSWCRCLTVVQHWVNAVCRSRHFRSESPSVGDWVVYFQRVVGALRIECVNVIVLVSRSVITRAPGQDRKVAFMARWFSFRLLWSDLVGNGLSDVWLIRIPFTSLFGKAEE